MDYRDKAIDELSRYLANCKAKEITKSRIVEQETALKSIRAGGTTPNSGGGNKTEHKWLSLIASIEDEKMRFKKVAREVRRVEEAMSVLPEDEARILRLVYIEKRNKEKHSMDEIAANEHISRATAYRLRDSALINFTRAFYGAVIT